MTQPQVHRKRRAGFTLIEVVVALAITGLFIAAFGEMMAVATRSWQRGSALVSASEMTLRGVRQIARDLQGVRVMLIGGTTKPHVLFDGDANVLRFVTAAENQANAKAGAIEIAILFDDDRTVIRRRSVGWGPSDVDFASLAWRDPVILLQGRYEAHFSFASIKGTSVVWRENWGQESNLPRLVKLTLTNRETGVPVTAPIIVPLLADVDAACVTEPRGGDCPATGPANASPDAQLPAGNNTQLPVGNKQ